MKLGWRHLNLFRIECNDPAQGMTGTFGLVLAFGRSKVGRDLPKRQAIPGEWWQTESWNGRDLFA